MRGASAKRAISACTDVSEMDEGQSGAMEAKKARQEKNAKAAKKSRDKKSNERAAEKLALEQQRAEVTRLKARIR